jgi:hypothetical protein
MRSREAKPNNFRLSNFLKPRSPVDRGLVSIAMSKRKISSLAIKICRLTLPMNLSFQLIKALEVAVSLAANLLKGLAITGVEAQAPATTSMKPSALG